MLYMSFNGNGIFNKLHLIQCLLVYDVLFICETWMSECDELNYFENLSNTHSIFCSAGEWG